MPRGSVGSAWLTRCRWSEQAVLVGVDDQLDAVAQVELGEDARHVGLDRRLREELGGGDLRVGEATGRAEEDLALARGEAVVLVPGGRRHAGAVALEHGF